MKTGAQSDYDRVRNTYYYTIESAEGIDDDDEIGRFSVVIPPFPYPEHQGSLRCLFCLHDLYVIGQDAGDRLTQTGEPSAAGGEDISGFHLRIQGLGLRNQDFTTALGGGFQLKGSNVFAVFNQYGQINNLNAGNTAVDNSDAKTLAGASNIMEQRLCSNPTGTQAIFEIYSMDTGVKLTANANLNIIIKFSIEIVPECGC